MSKGLEKAASEKANFAVFGPDNAQNARILKGALDSAPKGSLAGVTILYIGGSEQIEEPLKSSATSAGAEIRAAKYSGSGCYPCVPADAFALRANARLNTALGNTM
jgi:hypothetical protein